MDDHTANYSPGDWIAFRAPDGTVSGGIAKAVTSDGKVIVGNACYDPSDVRPRSRARELMS